MLDVCLVVVVVFQNIKTSTSMYGIFAFINLFQIYIQQPLNFMAV